MKDKEPTPVHGALSHRRLKILWTIVVVVLNFVMILLLFYFSWMWLLFFPLNFILIALFQALSHEFVEAQAPCPRCQTLNNIHNLTCTNCGLSFESLKQDQDNE